MSDSNSPVPWSHGGGDLWAQNPFLGNVSAYNRQRPSLRYFAKEGGILRTVDPTASGAKFEDVPYGTFLTLDFGSIEIGGISFDDGWSEYMSPLGASKAKVPTDGKNYQAATRIQAIAHGHGGLRIWTIFGITLLNRVAAVKEFSDRHPEAAAGQIPVVQYGEPERIDGKFGVYYTLRLELVGFDDRDPEIWGPRIVKPPIPLVDFKEQPAEKLPDPTAETPPWTETKVEAEAEIEAAPPKPKPQPKPQPQPQQPQQPAAAMPKIASPFKPFARKVY